MPVYDALRDYLKGTKFGEFDLGFEEIEDIIGRKLPASADRPQWWANQKGGARPQRDAWRDAGFEAFLLVGRQRVRFRKAH